jgi:uncharacterized membrane protein
MTQQLTNANPHTPRRRATTVALWVLQIVLALAFAMAGASKLAGAEQQMQLFDDIGAGHWLRYVVGILELAGAIGLLIPRLASLAALGLAGVMAGAVVTSAFIIEENPIAPLVLLVLAAVVAWGRRGDAGNPVRRLRGTA